MQINSYQAGTGKRNLRNIYDVIGRNRVSIS